MNTELQKRIEEWKADSRSGVTGDWKLETAISDKLCRVKWKRGEEAWKSCLTNSFAYNYSGTLTSDGTVLYFTFTAKRNDVKEYGLKAAFRALLYPLQAI